MILRVCNILYWKELLGFNIIIEVTRLGFYLDVRLANPLVYCVLTLEALKYNLQNNNSLGSGQLFISTIKKPET